MDTAHATLQRRWQALQQERTSWVPHWQEISKYLLPRSGRYFLSDRNRRSPRYNSIYDSTGTRALRTLAAGLMAGMTSPARPWFRLSTADPDLAKFGAVKVWINQTTMLMRRVFHRSNTYRALHSLYEELGAFGTGASIIIADYNRVIHQHPLTAGEYALATDWKGDVVTLYREFEQTVGALVREFGIENVTDSTRKAFNEGALDGWVRVVHAIEPRADRDPKARDAKNKPWRSVYFEQTARKGKTLRDSGFDRFPAVCPRWSVSGGDIYGNSPGMEALGDVKQLQQEQLRKGQGIDSMTNPPLQVPTSLKNRDVDILPGGVTFVDSGPNAGIRTQFDVRIDLSHLLADIQDVRGRINSAFYADLFLMLTQRADARMTATEVAERHEEKLLMLGPVLERLHNELLDPMIEITFHHMLAAGILPPPPQEMQGMDLNVEFVSMLAQAQQAVGTNSIDRFVGTLGQVVMLKPDVADKLDSDHWADAYGDMLGIDPEMIVPADKVALVRKARAEQAQKQAQTEQAVQASQALKNTSQVDTQQMGDIMDMFSGYTTGA
jgi:hypothetical protein